MDALSRSRRLVLSVAAAATLECGGWSGAPVGVAAPRVLARARAPGDAGSAEVSPVPDDFRSAMTRVRGRFASGGHAGRFDAIVWANDAARAQPDAAPDRPDGAMLVEEAIERGPGGDRPAGLLVMEKRAGAWRFVAVTPAGDVVGDERVAACPTCHSDAPRDDVFP